ncbi:Bbp16 family capsid cement protein [Pandoraea sputorum]|uniref:Bbp16 family capsid cement protein n=1 Tax=Pandoraea sputorum TaxID=93222 RepID=UPI001240A5A2|nr:hypothetical protein [Pandoraea sputorum]VVE77399.1 hypothetical protein PSP31120_01272 [Pandoraea sputorum]
MILDTLLNFSAAQAPTTVGDTASTNVVDTGAAHDEGIGENMFLLALINTAFTSGGAGTLQVVLQTSPDNSTWTDAEMSGALALASLTAGTMVRLRLPIGLQRYLRVAYRIGTAAMTAGAVSAYLVKDVDAVQYGAVGFSVQ